MPKRSSFADRLLGPEGRVNVQPIAETQAGMEQLPGGFTIARRFEVRAQWETYAATIKVEVANARARTVEVAVRTSRPGGVTSTMMMRVPIREVVTVAAGKLLHRVEVLNEQTARLLPVNEDEDDESATEAIRRLVGWVPTKGGRR